MKRIGYLYHYMESFSNLLFSETLARDGKTDAPYVIRFQIELEMNVAVLLQELTTQTYEVSKVLTFRIFDPKERIITALAYRDCVVQHCLVHFIVEPIFSKHYIYQNVACQVDKGTHFGLRLAGRYMQEQFFESQKGQLAFFQEHGYVLKCDIAGYFYNINHSILKKMYRRLIKDTKVLWLMDLYVDCLGGNRGIPIGFLISQSYALLYLSPLDHFIKEKLRIQKYVRYMDDFILIHPDKQYLKYCLAEIERFLHEELALELNSKTQIAPLKNGVDFLGFHTYITETGRIVRILRRTSKMRMKRKVKGIQKGITRGTHTAEQLTRSVHSWIGHAKHGNTYRLRKKILSQPLFQNKGSVINYDNKNKNT